ncbi:MAG: hypothetical protein MJ250_06485 [Alphaproteobacteria bacterium]|nr:hypothetical protein [Alphaproteobacteria bacterium]
MKVSMGSILGGAINIAGEVVDGLQKGTCQVIGSFVDDSETKKSICSLSNEISNTINGVAKPLSKVAELSVDVPVRLAGELGGCVARKTCELCDASQETIEQAEQYGKIVGKGIAGYMIGDVIASSLTSSLASPNGVGASEITSGLAELGGNMADGLSTYGLICSTTTLAAALTDEVPDLSEELSLENLAFMEENGK